MQKIKITIIFFMSIIVFIPAFCMKLPAVHCLSQMLRNNEVMSDVSQEASGLEEVENKSEDFFVISYNVILNATNEHIIACKNNLKDCNLIKKEEYLPLSGQVHAVRRQLASLKNQLRDKLKPGTKDYDAKLHQVFCQINKEYVDLESSFCKRCCQQMVTNLLPIDLNLIFKQQCGDMNEIFNFLNVFSYTNEHCLLFYTQINDLNEFILWVQEQYAQTFISDGKFRSIFNQTVGNYNKIVQRFHCCYGDLLKEMEE